MGGHDAELILVAGALLAAGIVGALLADRVRIPGLLLFLALGMLAGSEGIGGIEFHNTQLARTLGTIALLLILFSGGLTPGWAEDPPVLGWGGSPAPPGTVTTADPPGIAALAYGLAEVVHGSGLLATYLTALALGSSSIPARRTVVAFHEGVGWVAQIGLFILLGLLVFPSTLGDVALEGLALSAVLILIARPLAAFAATLLSPLGMRERTMLGWAGLRGATPIWLATFPVVAGVGAGQELFSIVFFVVVTSTLVQGASFEPLARRLGLTTDEPALPRRLLESVRIRRMGGDVVSYRLRPGAAAAGHVVRELGLPREALVNVIVRDGRAIPPRGSTEVREGDELHILVRGELREKVEELTRQWHRGPVGLPPPPSLSPRGGSQIFTVRPGGDVQDPSAPHEVDGLAVVPS